MIRVGVVGFGYWGPNLVRNLRATRGLEVVAIADLSQRRLAAAYLDCPGALLTSHAGDVLFGDRVDAVAVATSASTHAEVVAAALEAGKHVLVEKPLATTVADAERLARLAEERELALMVDHTFLHTPAFRRIAALVEIGKVGRVEWIEGTRVHWGGPPDVNALWDLGPHDASILLKLAGYPDDVSATTCAGGRSFHMSARYAEEGIHAHFHMGWRSTVKVRRLMVGCEHATVIYDDVEPSEKVKVYWRGDDAKPDQADYRTGDLLAPHLDRHEALASVCREYRDRIGLARAGLNIYANTAVDVVRLLASASSSAWNDGAWKAA